MGKLGCGEKISPDINHIIITLERYMLSVLPFSFPPAPRYFCSARTSFPDLVSSLISFLRPCKNCVDVGAYIYDIYHFILARYVIMPSATACPSKCDYHYTSKRVPKYLLSTALWLLSWFATNAPALLAAPGRQSLWLRCVLLNVIVKPRQLGITGTRDDNVVLWLATRAV